MQNAASNKELSDVTVNARGMFEKYEGSFRIREWMPGRSVTKVPAELWNNGRASRRNVKRSWWRRWLLKVLS